MSTYSNYISGHNMTGLNLLPIAVADAIHYMKISAIDEAGFDFYSLELDISVVQGQQNEYNAHAKV